MDDPSDIPLTLGKIDAKKARINTLTNLVNSQGIKVEELKNFLKNLPTTPSTPTPSFTTEDRKMLTDHSSILTSQAGLLKTICKTLAQLLTATQQTAVVAEGEKSKAATAEKPSSSNVPPPIVNIEEVGDDEEDEDMEPHDEEPSSSHKDGGDNDDDDEDGASLLSRKNTSKAAQSQGAKRSTEGEAADRSQPQGEQPLPEKTQSGTHQTLDLSSSPDSDQQLIATLISKPSTSTPTHQAKEPQKMDFSSSEE